ncbi:hypothetical protein P3T76_005573 [Phytophthora citrophthora]|uniref:Uncharacterized protein n=1 Tax=Phytophthora citrophthora TaxID=4793 RepID=A0AAD9LNX8_9STRA|nr:hypothetical protein P3T76_005573 [Phytophthora citrophthora]
MWEHKIDLSGWNPQVKCLSTDDDIPLSQCEQWLAPKSWKQGSYDAVFIKSVELSASDADIKAKNAGFTRKMLVRFVQLASSMTYPLHVGFFEDFLIRASHNAWVNAVGVCFVVPLDNMCEFQPPINARDFKREASAAFKADLTVTVSTQVLGLRCN